MFVCIKDTFVGGGINIRLILVSSKEDVEKCKDKDMIEELLAEMTGQFPAISEVFVTERDKFLSNSLYVACTPHQHSGGRGE